MARLLMARCLQRVGKGISKGFSGSLLFLMSVPALAAWELNMPQSVTDVGDDIFNLHMLIFWICVVIGVLVFGVMIYSIVKHRKSVHPEPATFTHSTTAEIAWTIVPIIILVGMAFPAAKVLVELEDNSEADLTVQVTGYQWNWHYEYPEESVAFFSKLAEESAIARRGAAGIDVTTVENYLLDVDRPMVVPVGKKVLLKLTANDVIHAWWVPKLGGKKDAIPGFVNTMWFKANEIGTYRGQCSELCGRDHGFMPIVVDVVSEEDYAAWVAQNTTAVADTSTDEAAASSIATLQANATGAVASSMATATTTLAAAAPAVVATAAEEVVQTAADSEAPAAKSSEMSMEQLMTLGEKIYSVHCVACHQADGSGLPPTFPALTGGAIATGPIAGHLNNVLNGQPGTAMIAFGAILSDEEIAAVVTYERNALGNEVGDMLSPADVAAARGN